MSEAHDFRKLVGHEPTQAALRGAGRREPFPSLVFSGPAGIGKRLTAVWYAAFLNCLDKENAAPCGGCNSCRKIISGGHPDLHFAIVPETKTVIGVGEIREAIHQLDYAPFEGNFRVLVVENAEKLTDEAQNALLKTLEEPPSTAIIMLITPLFGALIPTVVSRCRAVRFSPLSEEEIAGLLRDHGAESSKARELARLGRGLPGLALSFLVTPEVLTRRDEAVQLFLDLPGKDLWGATETATKLEKLKLGGVDVILALAYAVYRDLLVLGSGCPDLVSHETHLADMKARIQELPSATLRKMLRSLDEADQHRHANVNPKILLQRLCLALAKGGI